jgi:hypothetical protein
LRVGVGFRLRVGATVAASVADSDEASVEAASVAAGADPQAVSTKLRVKNTASNVTIFDLISSPLKNLD